MTDKNVHDSVGYPALHAILTCFAALQHAHTVLEVSANPPVNHVLPILEEKKGNLRVLFSRISVSSTQEPPHRLTQLLAKETLAKMEKIK